MIDLIKYYVDLLIIQYRNKVKARGTVGAIVKEVLINELPSNVLEAYDIETAVGDQLDTIGKYHDCSREISGIFGLITLGDEDYRTLIKLFILRNSSGSSLYDIKNILNQFFPGAIRVYDHMDMNLTYYVNTAIIESDDMANAFLSGGLLPFPMGVGGPVIFHDRLDWFFGYSDYRRQDYRNSPYNEWTDYRVNRPYMSYRYATEINVPEPVDGGFMLDDNNIDFIVQENGYYIVV